VILLDTVIFAVHLAKIGDQSKTLLPGSNPLTNFVPGGLSPGKKCFFTVRRDDSSCFSFS
jgi:hypothetical protein